MPQTLDQYWSTLVVAVVVVVAAAVVVFLFLLLLVNLLPKINFCACFRLARQCRDDDDVFFFSTLSLRSECDCS